MTSTKTAKERPILFTGPMVNAILEGRKTQTRRYLKSLSGVYPNFLIKEGEPYPYYYRRRDAVWDSFGSLEELAAKHCPYGKRGDRLWVRETWCRGLSDTHECWGYRADMRYQCGKPIPDNGVKKLWKPSIHMPRSYSRITLEVTDVRIEQVQNISEEDALQEGIEEKSLIPAQPCWRGTPHSEWCFHPTGAYKDTWNSVNKEHSWDSNPFVWVIEFRKLPSTLA